MMKNNVKDAVVFLTGSYGDVPKQAATINLPRVDVLDALKEVKPNSAEAYILGMLLRDEIVNNSKV